MASCAVVGAHLYMKYTFYEKYSDNEQTQLHFK